MSSSMAKGLLRQTKSHTHKTTENVQVRTDKKKKYYTELDITVRSHCKYLSVFEKIFESNYR